MPSDSTVHAAVAAFVLAALTCFGCYDLGSRLQRIEGPREWLWMTLGAAAIGSTFWEMNRLAILAVIPAADLTITPSLIWLSWLTAAGAAMAALYALSRLEARVGLVAIASIVIGTGIWATRQLQLAGISGTPSADLVMTMASFVIAVGVAGIGLLAQIMQGGLEGYERLRVRIMVSIAMGIALVGADLLALTARSSGMGVAAPVGATGAALALTALLSVALAIILIGSAVDEFLQQRHRLHLDRLARNAAAMRRLY